MVGKRLIHCDVETVGGFGRTRLIWSCAFVVTDAKGQEFERYAFLINEALPFIGADSFWSARKNTMQINCLNDYDYVSALEFHDICCKLFDSCDEFHAFNARFELKAFADLTKAYNLPSLIVPPSYDLALFAFDVLPFSRYARYAIDNGLYTDKGNLSSKCEHILAWLLAEGKICEVNHSHLALDDTLSQVELYKACLATKKKRPESGQHLTHFANATWKKWLNVGDGGGKRYETA